MASDWSISEAAAALGLTREAVRKRLRRGSLKGRKIGGEWRITPVEGGPPAARDGTGHVHPPPQNDIAEIHQALEQAKLEAAAAKGEAKGLRGRVRDLQAQLSTKAEELRRADHLLAQKEQTLAALVERVPMLPAPRQQGGHGQDAARDTARDGTGHGTGHVQDAARDTGPPAGGLAAWWRRVVGKE